MALTTRALHQQRITEACCWVSRFGYLRSTEIALLMYNNTASSERLARRLMQSLSEADLVLQRRASLCEPIHYALSEAGARLVREATGESCASGKDLIREVSAHRNASNFVCAQAVAAGMHVITDREMATSANRTFGGKVPDGLLVDDWTDDYGANIRDYHWIEVENSRRGGRDLLKLTSWLYRFAFPDRSGYVSDYRNGRLASVLFVISNPAARTIKARVLAKLDEVAIVPTDQNWLHEHAPRLIRIVDLTLGERFIA